MNRTIIGVWAQPISMFATWKARGINTLFGAELEGGSKTQKQWEEAAAAAGLCIVTLPDMARINEQAAQPHRLAFMQADEPDLNRYKDSEPPTSPNNSTLIPSGRYKGWRKPEVLQSLYAACKTAGNFLPVFCNFAGPSITPAAYDHGDGHDPYFPSLDWACADWHYLNVDAVRHSLQQQKDAMRRLAFWSASPLAKCPNGGSSDGVAGVSGSKLFLNYIEASDQNLNNANGRGPTADEYEAQVRNTMRAGCRGWINFAHRFGIGWPAGFDGATLIPGLVDRMKKLAAEFDPPVTPPPVTTLEQRVAELERKMKAISESAK